MFITLASVSATVNVNAVTELLVTLTLWDCVLLLSITEVLLTLICAIPLAATSSPANKMKKVRFSTKIASIETSVNDDNTRKCSPSHGKRPTRIKNLTLWLSTKL
jgi:hypothetical protein